VGAPSDLTDLGHGRGQAAFAAAASVWRMDAQIGRPVDVNSAYRDYEEQMRAYLNYQRDPKHYPLALHPDYSWHCLGMAIDTDDRLDIFAANGWRFVVSSEPWHGQYYAYLDQYYGQPAGGDSRPFPEQGEDTDDMGLTYDDKLWIIDTIRSEITGISNTVAAVQRGEINYPGAGYYAFPALTNVIREEHDPDTPVAPRNDE
jgi:hypothetical protein